MTLYGWGLILLKKLLAGTVLFGALSAYAPSQNAPHELQKELIGADRGIWEAIAGSHSNMDQVSAALALDYIDIDSGVRHSREVLSLTSEYVITELSYSSVQNGNAAAGKVLTTTVFSKEHGRWIAHLHTEMDVKPQTQ